MTPQPQKDPQDQAFGSAASEDQDLVDELDEQGVEEDDLPDQPARQPRAASKAEPADQPQDQ